MSLKLNFTTKESLDLVKLHNPEMWQCDLLRPVNNLLAFSATHRLSYTDALRAMTKVKSKMARKIYLMAAFQHIMDSKVKEYHKTNEQIQMYAKQLVHLIHAPWDKDCKEELKEHYEDRLHCLREKRGKLLSIKEVQMSLKVESETIKPSSHEKI